MKAYKAFDQDLKCLNFQYEIGQTYEINEQPILCKKGFHACLILDDVFAHYPYDPNTRICEVEILGDVINDEDSKLVTNKIKINKEITEEVLQHGYRTIKNHNGIHYYKDYKLHRENAPAVEYADGDKEYYINGKRHRLDGPAIEFANGYKAYYVNGQFLTEQRFNERTNNESL